MGKIDLFKKLDEYYGITGNENDIAFFVENKLKNYCNKVWLDKLGNVYGFIPSKCENAKKLMIETHLDCIGLMVKKIDENGFLQFEKLGPVDERILPASEVVVLGNENIFGVIGAKAAHICLEDVQRPGIKNMLIDVGMKKDAAEQQIQIGDFVALKSDLTQLLNNKIAGVGVSSRACIVTVFDLLEKLEGADLPYDLYVSFCVGRKSGSLGACTATFSVKPDVAIVIDAISGKTGVDDHTKSSFKLGEGSVISRTPDTCYDGTLNLIKEATKKGIPYNINGSGRATWSDVTAIQNVAGAVHTFLLSVPVRYMNQTVETVCLDDISSCSELAYLVASGGVCVA